MPKFYTFMFFFSLALVIAAVVVTGMWGLRLGTDFKGGTIWEVQFTGVRPDVTTIKTELAQTSKLDDANVSPVGDNGAIIRFKEINETEHQALLVDFQKKFGTVKEQRFSSIGSVVGSELKTKSMQAIVIVLLLITIYIAIVFRKLSRSLSSWSMGVSAIIALLHDLIIPIGIFALLGHFYNIEISAVFVAAALTILGFSVSDTVVIFDRVRENLLRFGLATPKSGTQAGSKDGLGAVVHRSVMETLMRSINTTLTVLLTLVAIFIWGGESIRYFSLALILGFFLGSYSSIFVASPLLVWWNRRHI